MWNKTNADIIMKKVAIISLPLMYNYGGFLQAYALMETLRRMGYDVTFLQRERNARKSGIKKMIDRSKAIIEKIGLGNLVYTIEKQTNSGLFYKTLPFRQFVKSYIKKQSPILRSTDELIAYCKKEAFNIYITGSDQIWRKDFAPSVEDAFLNFTTVLGKHTKISYAASLGTDEWTFSKTESKIIEKSLNDFRAISVREEKGKQLLKENLHIKKEINTVLDPTFLLTCEDYIKIADSNLHRKGILTYILNMDNNKSLLLQDIKTHTGCSSFSVINPETNKSSNIKTSQGYPVEQWLSGFRDADYVFTDSFHATVFSIIFNRPFWVLENAMRGNSRLTNILEIFELTDRFLPSTTKLSEIDWKRPINWEKVNLIKVQRIADSKMFLKNAIG